MKLGFVLGLVVGALAMFIWGHKETIKALYQNRNVIDKGTEAVDAAQTLYGDLKSIITSVRTQK